MKKINRLTSYDRRWNKEHLQEKYHLDQVVLPNHVADLDYEIPDFLIQGLKKRLDYKSLSYISLDDQFYEAIIWWYQNTKNVQLKKEWIFYSYGVLFSIIAFLKIATKKNDKVLIHSPCYKPFVELCKLNNREVILQPLELIADNFELDLKLTEEIIKSQKPKVYIFCNPLNPAGKIWSLATLNELARICAENNVLLISDEVHSELTLVEDSFNSILKVKDDYLNSVVVCSGLSKLYNVGGASASYTLIPNLELRTKFYNYLATLWLTNANIFGSEIIKDGYTDQGISWVKSMKLNHQKNYQFIQKYFIDHQLPFELVKLESGFCLVVKMNDVHSQAELEWYQEQFLQNGVIVRFSKDFFDYQNYWFRWIISTNLNDIKIFLEILKNICRKKN